MHRKLLSAAIAATMTLTLAACGTSQDDGQSADNPDAYIVGICEQMEHVSLSEATRGFKDGLVEILGEDSVVFREQNAGGEQANCTTIIDGFVSDGVDLILANATWPLQAAASATNSIPVLGTSVTDYATALNLDNFDGTIGRNISGTSDLVDLQAQAQIVQELFPEAENVGLLYCSGEPNSVYQIETVRGYLEDMGYTCEVYAFTDVNDLASVTQAACDSSDVIYIPTDNTVAANTESVANVVLAAGVPVVGGDPGICSGCGVATIATDYYEHHGGAVRTDAEDLQRRQLRYPEHNRPRRLHSRGTINHRKNAGSQMAARIYSIIATAICLQNKWIQIALITL